MRQALVDLRPLREHPTFRRLWLGSTATGFGAQLGAFAVTYYVWDRTHDPAAVGLIGLVTAAPMVAFALLGSAFLDHVERRRLVLLTTVAELVVALLMAAVAGTDGPLWMMLVLVGIESGLVAVGGPGRRSFIPRLLPPDRLAGGLALNLLSFQLAMLIGPATAGLLTAHWGTSACFLAHAIGFIGALYGVAGLPRTEVVAGAGRPGAGAIWEGIRFAARTPAARGAFLADLCATVLAMPVALFPILNEEKFGGRPELLGLFLTSVAVGGLVASGLSGLATRRRRPGLVLLVCAAVWGASLAAVGVADQLPVVLGLLAIAGGADTWSVVSRGTVVQASTPESHRGRISALEHIVGVAGPHLGGLRGGLVAAGSSGGVALLTGGLSCLAGLGLIAVLTPQLRRFSPREHVEPVLAAEPVPGSAANSPV